MPEPSEFIDPNLPLYSATRPSLEGGAGALAAVTAMTKFGTIQWAESRIFQRLLRLAVAADAAYRQC